MTEKVCYRCNVLKPLEQFEGHKRTKQNKIYYSWCKLCASARRKEYYDANPAKKREMSRLYRLANADKIKERARRYGWRLRLVVLNQYSPGGVRCACCGETELMFLAIDHVNGGGHKHNVEVAARGQRFAYWLKAHGFPPGYQVLCHNCNMAKGFYGRCPHSGRENKGVDSKKWEFTLDS